MSNDALPPAANSTAWWEQQIVEQQQRVEQALRTVTATDVYQQYQKELGVLEWLNRQHGAALIREEG